METNPSEQNTQPEGQLPSQEVLNSSIEEPIKVYAESDQVPPETEKIAERLSQKLSRAKEVSHQASHVLDKLDEELHSPDTDLSNLTSEQILNQLNDLSESNPDSAVDFYSSSKVVLSAIDTIKREKVKEQSALENKLGDLQHDVRWRLDQKLESLNEVKGPRKLLIHFQKKQIQDQKTTALKEIEKLIPEITSIKDEINNIYEQEQSLIEKREVLLLNLISQKTQEISQHFEEIADELVHGGIMSEVRNNFFSQTVLPDLDLPVDEKHRSIIEKARKLYKINPANSTESNQVRSEIYQLRHQDDRMYIAENYFSKIDSDNDKKPIYQMVAQMAAQEIAYLKENAKLYFVNYNQREKLSNTINNAIDPSGRVRTSDDNYPGYLKNEVAEHKYSHERDMNIWTAIKTSQGIDKIFGDDIREIDINIYKEALEKSLTDVSGNYIDKLEYYPTPEAIRNLVILAAADSREYRTAHANWVFDNLRKKDNWNIILDQAIEEIPELQTIRSMLEGWKYREYFNAPNIKSAAASVAEKIILDKNSNERLIELAMIALPNESIVKILTRRGLIEESQGNVLQEAISYLEGIYDFQQNKQYRPLDEYSLKAYFRTVILPILQTPDNFTDRNKKVIGNFADLSSIIIHNKGDFLALAYLTDKQLILSLLNPNFTIENSSIDFGSVGDLDFFSKLNNSYKGLESQLHQLIPAVGTRSLSKERLLLLPNIAKNILEHKNFDLARDYSAFFLASDEGVSFFKQFQERGIFSPNSTLNIQLGKQTLESRSKRALNFPELVKTLAEDEISNIDKALLSSKLNTEELLGWNRLLFAYARIHSEQPKFSPESIEKINKVFDNQQLKDNILSQFGKEYLHYLEQGNPDEFPFTLSFLTEFISQVGGVGPLSQINSLNSFINSLNLELIKSTTTSSTKNLLCQGLLSAEKRFVAEKWSNEDKTDFYNISRDILDASPSLFTDFLDLFSNMSPPQLKRFSKDIYPYYRMKLAVLEKSKSIDNKPVKYFDSKNLLEIRTDIRKFSNTLFEEDESFGVQKGKLIEEITETFKERFGITKIPELLTSEHIRSLTDITLYLSNLQARSSDKENILSFYLALMINNKWQDFRLGKTINPAEYLTDEKSLFVNNLLRNREMLNPLKSQALGLEENDMPEFMKILQAETSNVVIGDIETVDVKLLNIAINLKDLHDPNLYPKKIDRERMNILMKWGNKRTGSVIAKMYQELSNPTKVFKFSDEEVEIKVEILKIMKENHITKNSSSIKQHFQEGIRTLSTINSLVNLVDHYQVEQEVSNLRTLLIPSPDIIRIFGKLGEDFKPNSGAYAVSQDINYLENLIIKHEDELNENEKEILQQYLSDIKSKIVSLENVYFQIENKFTNIKQSTKTNNKLITARLTEIERIITSQATQQILTSSMTNNLNIIIENIRQCLSCKTQGANNDTNLSFGDQNKFYLYTETDLLNQGSISDEIVFIEPTTLQDGTQSLAFILDRVYGTNTPTILENQFTVVYKKLKAIKNKFPKANIQILISDASLNSAGTNSEMFLKRLHDEGISSKQEQLTIDIAESATGDHYVEFGGGARTPGKRQVFGIVVK